MLNYLADLIAQIDEALPQTQCQLCGYAGCKPYAQAIAENNETINRCPPGGVKTLLKLAAITHQDAQPYIQELQQKAKPAMLAVIREDECIGCTKCIQACPVDAIIGAAKQMHTVLTTECTGCELCVAPCPVDCITMQVISEPSEQEQQLKANHARQRFNNRNQRLAENKTNLLAKKSSAVTQNNNADKITQRKAEIAAAVARVKAKRSGVRHRSV